MTGGFEIVSRGSSVKVPPGTYFLGDPCYAVPNDEWMHLLESCGYFDCNSDGEGGPVGTTPEGDKVLAFGTAYGDGVYVDDRGHQFPVDAGLIGLTPESVFRRSDNSRAHLDELGLVVTFKTFVTASDDGGGRLVFGSYRIDTSDDAMEDWS